MRTFIDLKGFYEGLRARRLEVFGRLELLQVFNDPPAYWLIRLYGKERSYDAQYWDHKDTGLCRRFTGFEAARAKFKELCSRPEYQSEAQEAEAKRVHAVSRALEMQASGKLKEGRHHGKQKTGPA
jgi:hypothetical protein